MRAILTYHSIDDSGSPISVAPEDFRRQVRWLASGRVRVVPLRELAALPGQTDAVALTFDDAFANFGAIAWPMLRDAGLPVTQFVVTGHAGGTNAWGGVADPRVPTLPLLDWAALGRLAQEGLSLGAHTRSHPHLPAVPDAALAEELGDTIEVLRRETGQVVDEFAYPYGAVDRRVATAVARSFRWAVTTELRPLGLMEDPVRLPRLDMFYLQAPGKLEAWGTPRFAGGIWVRAQARRLRQTLAVVGGGW